MHREQDVFKALQPLRLHPLTPLEHVRHVLHALDVDVLLLMRALGHCEIGFERTLFKNFAFSHLRLQVVLCCPYVFFISEESSQAARISSSLFSFLTLGSQFFRTWIERGSEGV